MGSSLHHKWHAPFGSSRPRRARARSRSGQDPSSPNPSIETLLHAFLLEERSKARGGSAEEYMRSGNLLKREVLAEDVAQAFVALALARKTTAATLTVDGGNIEASLR